MPWTSMPYYRGSRNNLGGISLQNFILNIYVPYHCDSQTNRNGIIAHNFKNVTTLFLNTVPS